MTEFSPAYHESQKITPAEIDLRKSDLGTSEVGRARAEALVAATRNERETEPGHRVIADTGIRLAQLRLEASEQNTYDLAA